MFKQFFEKKFINIAERDLREYTQQVSMLTSEECGLHLAYACMSLLSMVEDEDSVDIEKIINTKENIYGKELSTLVLKTNRLVKDYNYAQEMQGAAGTKVWNETFRCLIHPELTIYGEEIWSYLSDARHGASLHLDEIEEMFIRKGNDSSALKIKEARKYLDLIPARFVKESNKECLRKDGIDDSNDLDSAFDDESESLLMSSQEERLLRISSTVSFREYDNVYMDKIQEIAKRGTTILFEGSIEDVFSLKGQKYIKIYSFSYETELCGNLYHP
jgi:hypothetical protein